MPENEQKTDEELVALSIDDAEQFGRLVERYEARLFRYIRRISGFTKELAEDVLQEVFMSIHENLNNFDQNLSFSSWSYRIAHNKVVSHIRKDSKLKIVPIETDEDDVSLIDLLASDLDLENDLSKKEQSRKVQKALSMLSIKYKEILVLKFLEDMSYDEISDVLKIPMGTVATLISRAKEQFRQIVKKNNIYF